MCVGSYYVESQSIAQGSCTQGFFLKIQNLRKRRRRKSLLQNEDNQKNVLIHICKFSFFIVSYFHENSEWIIILKVFLHHVFMWGVCVCLTAVLHHPSFRTKWITCSFGFYDWCCWEWYSTLPGLRWSSSESNYASFKLL